MISNRQLAEMYQAWAITSGYLGNRERRAYCLRIARILRNRA